MFRLKMKILCSRCWEIWKSENIWNLRKKIYNLFFHKKQLSQHTDD